MPWTPGTALSSAAVAFSAVEGNSLTLWKEFLEGWFDGAAHTINATSITFPVAKTSFQVGNLVQPLDGLAISMVWLRSSKPARRRNTNQRKAFLKTSWQVWIRSQGVNTGTGGPAVVVRKASDLLLAVLSDKTATHPLARKGIHHIEATNQSVVTSEDFHTRSMIVTAELRYVTASD
jgi:hypothetical protein